MQDSNTLFEPIGDDTNDEENNSTKNAVQKKTGHFIQ